VSLAAQKSLARSAAQARRAEAHAKGQGNAAQHLAQALTPFSGQVLAGYMPMREEIDPLPAMVAHTGPVVVPVVIGKGQPLRFRKWSAGAPMVPGAFGALIPQDGDWLVPQVLIVPLLAFDARGHRLGYGGGYYDRTLQALRAQASVTAIGFAYGAQQIEAVPVDLTDQPLDLIVTESGPVALRR
jgi:5-formyltetrahydrofolate cyclo-ligase